MLDTIRGEFNRYDKTTGLVFFLLCPQNSRFHEALTTSADFWNRYSDRYVTILVPGYVGALSTPEEPYQDIVKTLFSYDAFKEVTDYFEQSTTWTYHGGTQLIGVMTQAKEKIAFDFRNALVVDVDALDPEGKFDLNRYMVKLIDTSKSSPENPLPAIGKEGVVDFIVSAIRAALPKQLVGMLDAALKSDIRRDISRVS